MRVRGQKTEARTRDAGCELRVTGYESGAVAGLYGLDEAIDLSPKVVKFGQGTKNKERGQGAVLRPLFVFDDSLSHELPSSNTLSSWG